MEIRVLTLYDAFNFSHAALHSDATYIQLIQPQYIHRVTLVPNLGNVLK